MRLKELVAMSCVVTMAVECAFVLTPAAKVEATEKSVGDRWIESDIKGNVTKNTVVNYKDDFSAAVNKEWLSTTELPDGYVRYSTFDENEDIMRERKLSLIHDSSLKSHDASLIKTLYNLVGDWSSRNEAGVSTAMPYIEAVKSITSTDELTEFLMNADMNPLDICFSAVSTGASYNDATRYTVYVDEPSYFLNYPEDYTDMTATGKMYYDYDQQVSNYLLQRFGYTEKEAEEIFDGAIKFESMMAPYLYTSAEQSSVEFMGMIDNVYTLQEIAAIEGNYPISEMIVGTGYGQSSDYMVVNPDFIKHFGELYTNKNIGLIKDYLLAHEAVYFADMLDRDAYETENTISNSVYGGSGMVSDEENCYDVVNSYLAWPLDNLYVDKYCTEERKDKVIECGEEVRAYYRKMLEGETWLSEETRAAAIDKLDKMTIHAVIPEKQYDYSGLKLTATADGGTFIDATMEIAKFEKQRNISKIGKTVDADEWGMPTSMVNAYYTPLLNAIYIMDGMTVSPMLDDENNYEEFLAVIGTTLGHEISHAFDTNGAQFDADGNMVNWWTDEDYSAYIGKTQKVVDYLNSITPFEDYPDMSVDGELVKTEYIADLVSFKPVIAIARQHEDFNWDLFFQARAAMWRMVATEEKEVSQLQSNEHPLGYIRVNAICQQYQEFYDTYDIQPGDGMYLAPADRLEVW